jgi:uncharacterized membrane protein YhhN
MTLALALAAIVALVDWTAVWRGWRTVEYVAKPATMVFLIVWLATSLPESIPRIGTLVLLGLGLSLAGDVFLMLPNDRFVSGLAAFLLAHLAYIAAFNPGGPSLSVRSIILAVVLAGCVIAILRPLLAGIRAKGKPELAIPVAVYAVVLAAMLWSAATSLLRPAWPRPSGAALAAGGVLFFISDLVLAWGRFVRPVPGGRLLNMVTYHLAQAALAAGVVLSLPPLV